MTRILGFSIREIRAIRGRKKNVNNQKSLLFPGKFEERQGQVAIAVWVLVKIVLMVLLCRIETFQRFHLNGNRLTQARLLLTEDFLDDGQLVVRDIIDSRTIPSALIVALTVQARRLDGMEKHVEQELKVAHRLVILDTDRLGITRRIGINLLISGIVGVAVGKTHFRLYDTLDLLEEMLRSPKASPG